MMRNLYLAEARAHLPADEYQRLLATRLPGAELHNVVIYEAGAGWTWKVRTDPTATPADCTGVLYSLRVLVATAAQANRLPVPADLLTAEELAIVPD